MLPTYFINLDARTDRREFMERQFARLGIDAERSPAVVPADVPRGITANSVRPPTGRELTPSELACNLSHLAALRRLIASGAPAGFVLEDDGILSPGLLEFLKLLEHGLPAEVDIIKAETYRTPARLGSTSQALPGFEIRRLMSTHHGSCGYAISRKMALDVLADPVFNHFAVDAYLFGRIGPVLFRRGIFQLVPALVVQLRHHPWAGPQEAASSIHHPKAPRKRRTARQRLHRLLENVHSAAKDAVYFGHEARALLSARQPVSFAAEDTVSEAAR